MISEDAFRSSPFASPTVDRVRDTGGVWRLPGGTLRLPEVFGFCRGVERALEMMEAAVAAGRSGGKRLVLLGEIIHNPWVNEHFRQAGVRILCRAEHEDLESRIQPEDCAVIPAFGVPLPVEQRLGRIGCEVVDTSCGDVRRLWLWADRAVKEGRGVLIFGRASHDETVVTKSRIAAAGGRYVVAGSLDQVRRFADLIAEGARHEGFRIAFGREATNAESLEPFVRLAQISQTTMLYEDTMRVRGALREGFERRFGADGADERLAFQPTVCRATQDRQTAAVELCRSGVDLVIVVGGFGSSNTRHLYELARQYAPAHFIEGAGAIRSACELRAFDPALEEETAVLDWLPERRPLSIGVLAGASCPEAVVGEALERLAAFLR